MPDRPLRVLFIGDIIGRPGRRAVRKLLPELRRRYDLDLVIANGENAAGGIGLTPAVAEELFQAGVDILTSGNHIWRYKEIIPYLEGERPILRPLNYPPGVPGRGFIILNDVVAVNLIGRIFMEPVDCPFRAMDELLKKLSAEGGNRKIIIVDFHGEATSEKGALARYLDGRVSAVLGTHTHVGTIDAQILPKGTAFVTDVGMVGPKESVIGDDVATVIRGFLHRIPVKMTVGKGDVIFNSVLLEIDPETGKAKSISRLDLEVKEDES